MAWGFFSPAHRKESDMGNTEFARGVARWQMKGNNAIGYLLYS